jgi:hypothetical protein
MNETLETIGYHAFGWLVVIYNNAHWMSALIYKTILWH